MRGIRALSAPREIDVASSTLVTRVPREPRTASTHTGCPVSISCHISGFAAAVIGVRALCTVRVGDVAESTNVTRGAIETMAACAQACCVSAIGGP